MFVQKTPPTKRFFFFFWVAKPNPVSYLDRNCANRPTNTPLHYIHISFVVQRFRVGDENANNTKQRSPTFLFVREISASYIIVVSVLSGARWRKIIAVMKKGFGHCARPKLYTPLSPDSGNLTSALDNPSSFVPTVCYNLRACRSRDKIGQHSQRQSVGNRACCLTSVAARRYA